MEGRVNLITSHLGVSVDRRKKEATRKRCLADEVLFRVPGLLQDQSFHGVVSTCFNMFQNFCSPFDCQTKTLWETFPASRGPSGPREEAKTDDRLMEEQEQQRQEKFSAGLRFLTFR